MAATINFKNVGTAYDSKKFERAVKREVKIPYGIRTPLRLGSTDSVFEMHTDIAGQIHDNLKNLLLTNHGERVGMFNFGANLRPLMFELIPGEFEEAAPVLIKRAVSTWLPFIELNELRLDIVPTDVDGLARIDMTITYSIDQLDVYEKPLRLIFRLGG